MTHAPFNRSKVDLNWLLKLRWAAICGQLATIGVVAGWMHIPLPLHKLLAVIGIGGATNLALAVWLHDQRRNWPAWAGRGQRLFGSVLMLDNLLLTALLYYTGGPSNPFTVFYLVNIALAAALLPARWAWSLDAAALSCFALLFAAHISLPELEHGPDHEHLMHHHTRTAAGPMSLHLQGSLVAFGLAATFIVYFVTRIAGELAQRESELEDARRRQAQSEKLESLVTLAAGAAHELASPLSTIALIAKDLETAANGDDSTTGFRHDVQLIRSETARCRKILDLMIAAAAERPEDWAWTTPAEILAIVVRDPASGGRLGLQIEARLAQRPVCVPVPAVSQALRAIVDNALHASPPDQGVRVDVLQVGDDWQIHVVDRGSGMPDNVLHRAGEPFFTTKEPGAGMGLGLFLARRVVESLGEHSESNRGSSSARRSASLCLSTPPRQPGARRLRIA